MRDSKITRRGFLAGVITTVAAGCATTGKGRRAPGKISTRVPGEKLNIAGIGVGGKGGSDVQHCNTENIVALCDVDDAGARGSFEAYPTARKFRDYRKMLDTMKEIDAVTISTPDHMHAPIAMYAMALGKHLYVQKPLTYTVGEARMLAQAAKKHKVVTQMGNQGHSGDGVRQLCELIWSGAIGQVTEVHTWTNRPIWPQGIPGPLPEQPIPPTLDWDLWLGVAPKRPYNRGYAPFNWRGWWDFGCGALGDMACHIMDPANWALKLHETGPKSVEVVRQAGGNSQTFPTLSSIKYEFPRRGKMKPVTVYWHDGFTDPSRPVETQNLPPRPENIRLAVKLGDGGNGSYFIGEKGILSAGSNGGGLHLLSEGKTNAFNRPPETIPRIRIGPQDRWDDNDFQHHQDWIRGIKGGPAPCSNFSYSGPFTEYVLLGNLALRANRKLEWDAKRMKVKNLPEANAWVHKSYPAGWGIG